MIWCIKSSFQQFSAGIEGVESVEGVERVESAEGAERVEEVEGVERVESGASNPE